MKREVMEAAGLEIYAVVGLIIFFIVFIFIVVRLYLMKSKEANELSELPLADDTIVSSDADSSNQVEHEPQGGLQ